MIAGAADEVVETGALAAKNEDAVAGEIELVVVGRTAFVETNDPEILPLEVFEGAHQVDDPRDAKVLGRSCTCLYRCGTQRRRAPLGKNDTVDSGTVGHPQQCAKVLRIFDAIESQQKTGRAGLACNWFGQVFKGKKLLRANNSDHTLVCGGSGQSGEMFAWLLADSNTGLTTVSNEAGESVIVPLAGHQHVVKAATAGLECLLDWMEAVENFHESSLDCR
jgi:hypothetical protein